MQRILVICPTGSNGLLPLQRFITGLQQRSHTSEKTDATDNCDGGEGTLVNICFVDDAFENVMCNKREWQPVQSLDVETLSDAAKNSTDDTESVTSLASYLHGVSDDLPYAGFVLEVVFIHPKLSKESCTLILGACMRLRDWHGARTTLVLPEDGSQDSEIQLMVSVLQADVLHAGSFVPLCLPQWRGVLNWTTFVQSGVSLVCPEPQRLKRKLETLHYWRRKKPAKGGKVCEEPSELVFGRKLEILAHISLASVPLYLIDNFNVELHAGTESRFSNFAESLSKSDALLVRLPVYKKDAMPTAVTMGLSEAAWKEAIAATGRPATDPEKFPLPCRQHLFMLVLGASHSKEAGQFKAIVMRSPTEINPSVFEKLHQLAYFGGHDNNDTKTEEDTDLCESITRQMEALPMISADTFHTVDSVWLESFVELINGRKAKGNTCEPVQVTKSDLLTFIKEGQELLLSLGVQKKRDSSSCKQEVQAPPYVAHPDEFGADLQCEPSEWPERESLSELECKEKGLRRFQSGDSLGLSSPLGQVDESSLDAKDMLKWFKPDGSAVLNNLSPVKVVSGPPRLSSHDEANLQWPYCKDAQYHDVYYEHNKHCEKYEQRFKKFRDTIMLEESHHTFTDNPHIPALKYRRSRHPSQMDVSCGGRKLTPITRRPAADSAIMAAPASVRSRRDRTFDGRKELMTSSGKLVRASSHSDRRLSAPPLMRKNSFSRGSSSQSDIPPVRRQQSLDSVPSSSQGSVVHVFPSSSGSSSALSVRRLSHSSDTVNIFTPPSSRAGSNQVTPESPLEGGSQSQPSGTPVTRSRKDNSRRISNESNASIPSVSGVAPGSKESRSQRHKRKLEETVAAVLEAAGVPSSDLIYSSCFTKLYQVTKFFVKQLPNSRNLRAEMKEIAEKQVQQVVDLERRRQDLAVKKKLRTSSIVSK